MGTQYDLSNKNILVTGASSGLGQSIAVACSRAGANLFLIARDETRLQETFSLLSVGKHDSASVDMTDYQLLEQTMNTQVRNWGLVHGFVHAAGEEMFAPVQFTKPIHFKRLFEVNTIAGFEATRVLIQKKLFDPEHGASFIFLSSISAIKGLEGTLAYAVSKGALLSGARVLALELARKKIRVNTLIPSLVHTPMANRFFDSMSEDSYSSILKQHPLGFGFPEDVANACMFFLADESRWITGTDLVLDGGFSIK
jgi:NAD(P)-dependent dehydrogenase (short-subunit alcohol dehydrogenase family)